MTCFPNTPPWPLADLVSRGHRSARFHLKLSHLLALQRFPLQTLSRSLGRNSSIFRWISWSFDVGFIRPGRPWSMSMFSLQCGFSVPVSLLFLRSSLLSSMSRRSLRSRLSFQCLLCSQAHQFQLMLRPHEQRSSYHRMRVLVPFVLRLVRADNACPSWSLRTTRSCGLALVPSRCRCKREVCALRLEREMFVSSNCAHECAAHIVSTGSWHQRWTFPCVSLRLFATTACSNNCQSHRGRSECGCFIGTQQRFIVVVNFLVSKRRKCSRLRTQPKRFPRQVHVSWVWFQCHDSFSTDVAKIYQPAHDSLMFVIACSPLQIPASLHDHYTFQRLLHFVKKIVFTLEHKIITMSPPVAVFLTTVVQA